MTPINDHPAPANAPAPARSRSRERRRNPRLNAEFVHSPLGQVVELSMSGLRIEGSGWSKADPGQRLFLTLQTPSGEFKVKSQVVWSKKTGFRRIEMGLQFLDLTADEQDRIRRLAARCVSVVSIFSDR